MVLRLKPNGVAKWGDAYHRYAKRIGVISAKGLALTDAAWTALKPELRAHVRGNPFVAVVDAPPEAPKTTRRTRRTISQLVRTGEVTDMLEDEG